MSTTPAPPSGHTPPPRDPDETRPENPSALPLPPDPGGIGRMSAQHVHFTVQRWPIHVYQYTRSRSYVKLTDNKRIRRSVYNGHHFCIVFHQGMI